MSERATRYIFIVIFNLIISSFFPTKKKAALNLAVALVFVVLFA